MAGLKPPNDAEVELCVNCGLPPCKVDPTITITLLFSKATRQVLCLEVGKDFVDTLLGFLTLPMGCIIKFLEEASMIHRPECKTAPLSGMPCTPRPKIGKNESGVNFSMSSISNIFKSVIRLDSKEMSADEKCLVDPKPAIPFGSGKLLALPATPSSTDRSTMSTESPNFYGCGDACSFYTTSPATKCPQHKKKMRVLFKMEPGQMADANKQSDANSQVENAISELLHCFALWAAVPHQLTDLQNSNWAGTARRSRIQRGRACASDACAVKQPIPSRAQSRQSTLRPSTAKISAAPAASDPEVARRGLSLQLPILPTSPAPSMNPIEEGYVKEGTKYMITNTLDVHASSEAIKALITLNIIRCERVGDLDTMPVSVVRSEVLELLKLSFTSTNVLNDVFSKYCADVKAVVFEENKEPFFPQCAETPCCQCFLMGTPLKGGQD